MTASSPRAAGLCSCRHGRSAARARRAAPAERGPAHGTRSAAPRPQAAWRRRRRMTDPRSGPSWAASAPTSRRAPRGRRGWAVWLAAVGRLGEWGVAMCLAAWPPSAVDLRSEAAEYSGCQPEGGSAGRACRHAAPGGSPAARSRGPRPRRPLPRARSEGRTAALTPILPPRPGCPAPQMGIVGMPNVGKSTLFNTLSKMGIPAENFPFCTIDPNNVGGLWGYPGVIRPRGSQVQKAALVQTPKIPFPA